MDENKNLIRIANCIRDTLVKLKEKQYLELLNRLTNFTSQLQELNEDCGKLGKAVSQGWYAAAQQFRSRIARSLSDISYILQRNKQLVDATQNNVPKLSVLLADLKQLQADCGDIEFDRDGNNISIVTDPIELDGIYLGPFKIQLDLNKLTELHKDTSYYCIALEPNPAATDESVTHPHVSNEKLCEGDGSVAIRAALEEGRLCDFFTMVRNILNTYNPDSPYISLSDWEGTPCYDCGYTCDRENCYYCSYCDHEYCEECSSYCRLCDETVCLGCGGKCPHCEEMVCPNCITRCKECEELCCKECLDEGLCPNCIEERKENEEPENQNTTTERCGDRSQPEAGKPEVRPDNQKEVKNQEATDLAVQPNRMGETTLLQRQI